MSLRSFFLILIATLLPGLSAAEKKTVRLLTIGNSFSRNATNHLDDLVASAGHTLIHRPIVVGGASLQLHAEKAQAYEANPKSLDGLYANGRSLRQELADDVWDYVTIQQASIKSHDISTYRPYAEWLKNYICKHAPKAKLLMHQTWAYRKDDPRFTQPSDKPGEPADQEAMFRGLTNAYKQIASEVGAGMLPVGAAFFSADSDATWGYRPIPASVLKTIQFPALPDQTHSLHVGWRWQKQEDGKSLLRMDGHHANLAGEYLGACVWFEVLYDESVTGNQYIPQGLAADHAQFLRETAHKTLEQWHNTGK
jgi:hypothetical protein